MRLLNVQRMSHNIMPLILSKSLHTEPNNFFIPMFISFATHKHLFRFLLSLPLCIFYDTFHTLNESTELGYELLTNSKIVNFDMPINQN